MITQIRFRASVLAAGGEAVVLQVFDDPNISAIGNHFADRGAQRAEPTWRDAKVEDLHEASRVIHTSGLTR